MKLALKMHPPKQITTGINGVYILIASTSTDLSVEPVIAALQSLGHTPIVYYADHAVGQKTPFTTHINARGQVLINIGDQTFTPSQVGAAWYRRPNSLEEIEPHNLQRRTHIENNVRLIHNGIFATLPDSVWLNEPQRIRKAELKLYQLQCAAEAGLEIPQTSLTNKWSEVQKLGKEVIVKLPIGFLENNNKKKFLYTTPLNNPHSLPVHATPYPGMWQPNIPKKREWRVTIVGNKVFAAAIYTSKEAKNDWREHQRIPSKVRFEKAEFPKKITKKCFALLKQLGLKFGAFDFIETPDGKIFFLEVNANGQYGWLEDRLGFPISSAIAEELYAIAESNRELQKAKSLA